MLAIICSKDRPAQLDLLLRSMYKYGYFQPYIIYKASDDKFLSGYKILQKEFDADYITFHEEDHFQNDVLTAITKTTNNCVGFFTDDSVFYSYLDILDNEMEELLRSDLKASSFVTRCGLNTSLQKHWPPYIYQQPLKYQKYGDLISWNFMDHSWEYDYGRPFSLDGSIHRKEDILHILTNKFTNWNSPRELDDVNSVRDQFSPHKICSWYESILVNIPVNLTFGGHADNWGHYNQYSLEDLNERWLSGERIVMNQHKYKITCAHQELPFEWEVK